MIVPLDYPGPGTILLEATSDIEMSKRVVACQKEQETVVWIKSMRPGETFWDIGANTGAYSLVAWINGLEVVAFEPHPPTLERLEHNIALNTDEQMGPARVHIRTYGHLLGDGSPGELYESSPDPGAASHRFVYDPFAPETVPLDLLVTEFGQPDHIKIDTDGGEDAIIRGGFRTLSAARSVQVEVDDTKAWKAERLLASLHACGLRAVSWTRHGQTAISNVLFRRLS